LYLIFSHASVIDHVQFELPDHTFTKSSDLDTEMELDQAELVESDIAKQAEEVFKKSLFKV